MKADAKKIAVIGASGKAGSRIAKEAADRGHRVTAIVRDRSKIADPRFQIVEKDIFRLTAEDLVPFDAVVNAFGAPPGREQQHVEALGVLIRTLAGAPRTRLIVIGGAGSLFVDEAETTRLLDAPGFPPLYLETARQQAEQLRILRETEGIRWTFVSPSAHLEIGKRTGNYRTGKDRLLFNAGGESYVSYEDLAVAIVDEIERQRHVNERFTVVSERA